MADSKGLEDLPEGKREDSTVATEAAQQLYGMAHRKDY